MSFKRSARYADNIRRVSVHSSYRDSSSSRPRKSAPVGPDGPSDGSYKQTQAPHEQADQDDEDKLHDDKDVDKDDDGHVRVAVRCRPMSEREVSAGYESVVDLESERKIVVHDVSETPSDQLGTNSGERRNVSHVYEFDRVFGRQSSQAEVYERACRPIVQGALEGYNGTILAYGQTGTGKTYTMEGVGQPYRRRPSETRRDSSDNGGGSPSAANRRAASKPARKSTASMQDETTPATSGQAQHEQQQQQRRRRQESEDQAGIIPRTFGQIFDHVARHPEIQFLIRASYLEIYQEEIRDLLRGKGNKTKLELHERQDAGVYVKDLTSFVCKSIKEIERVMRVGNQNRIVGATDMNEHSSRSHAIFMITIEQQSSSRPAAQAAAGAEAAALELTSDAAAGGNNVSRRPRKQPGPSSGDNKKATIRVGKLNLVDLAGSERQRKTNSSGHRQRESIKINLSLSALGNVINSLMKLQQQQRQQLMTSNEHGADNYASPSRATPPPPPPPLIHTPYRDSKLTRLLQDSLGGNARTLMIANIGPASYNYDETINTLNYASRARCIKNRPKLNEDPKDALLRQLQREIDLLRAKLAAINQQPGQPTAISGGGGGGGGGGGALAQSDDRIKAMITTSEMATTTTTTTTSSEQSSGVSSAKSSRDSAGSGVSSSQAPPAPAMADGRQVKRELFELRQKLSSLESKLLNGDKSSAGPTDVVRHTKATASARPLDTANVLKGLTRERELELERRQHELATQASRERTIRDELERREEVEMLAKQSFSSIQQEVDSKRRLIRQVLLRVKALRDELDSSQAAYRIELEELEQLQYVLQRELKLKCLIMDNFVASSQVDQLLARIIFDDKRNLCSIEPFELATSECCQIGAAGARSLHYEDFWRPTYNSSRPKSEFERISEAIFPSNIRYKYEELLEPRLEFNQRPVGVRRLSERLRGASGRHELMQGAGRDTAKMNSRAPALQALLIKTLDQREPDLVI